MKKTKNTFFLLILLTGLLLFLHACSIPEVARKEANARLPANFTNTLTDTLNSAHVNWKDFFEDPFLTNLIDSALLNNQEINILAQRISRAKNEIQARKGEYLPFVHAGAGADVEKVGRFTRNGAVERNLEIEEGREFPEPLGNLQFGLSASWELDVWKKLRKAKQAAALEYLASVEGKNFLITNLVAEIADSYYELLALDNQLETLERNIRIQQDALEVVKNLQQAARTNSLAVKRFEAEVQKNQSEIYKLKQNIIETENRINFLAGRTPRPIARNAEDFLEREPKVVQAGIPSQLLENRPDIRKAELELMASRLNVQVAKANFFPSFGIKAGLGYQAFNPKFLLNTPESVLFSLAGDALAPVVNRNAIIAEYKNAGAHQIQAVYEFEQTILNAYREVMNQLSKAENLAQNIQLKQKQVEALTESIEIAIQLFQSARADYMEVLLTQRDALEAKMELIETQKEQMGAMVHLYRALGGGWK
jgi:NodT family efflux transporter outer membrane factor (OMF) lipoprotein